MISKEQIEAKRDEFTQQLNNAMRQAEQLRGAIIALNQLLAQVEEAEQEGPDNDSGKL